jgi:hypothetical protein
VTKEIPVTGYKRTRTKGVKQNPFMERLFTKLTWICVVGGLVLMVVSYYLAYLACPSSGACAAEPIKYYGITVWGAGPIYWLGGTFWYGVVAYCLGCVPFNMIAGMYS